MPEWPKCAKYPALECVCRGALVANPTTGSCLRERTGDFTPLATQVATQQKEHTMSQVTAEATGLEGRYRVEKVNDPTGKHADCRYFVLDPQHDPIARAALARYAQVARVEGFGPLADDLTEWLTSVEVEKVRVVQPEGRGPDA